MSDHPDMQEAFSAAATEKLLAAQIQERVNARDWTGVLTIYEQFDTELARPDRAAAVMNHAGVALHWLGRGAESRAQFTRAVRHVDRHKLLEGAALTARTLELAVMAAMGARDLAALKNLMTFKFRAFFAEPRDITVSPLKDLRAWCAENGVVIDEIEPARDVVLDPSPTAHKMLHYRAEPYWTARIPGGQIVAGWDFVASPAGEVLTGASYSGLEHTYAFMPHLYYPDLQHVAHAWSDEPIAVDADVLHLGCPERFHHGHWLVDFLPRLLAWRRPDKIAVPENLPRKLRETLTYFGVGPDDMVACAFAKRHRFRSVLVTHPGHYLIPNPTKVRFVAESFGWRPLEGDAPARRRKVFLTRALGTRNIVNRDEFDALLAEFDIETIDVARLSIAEQTQLFAETGCVMGVFGSDLWAIYHMKPGTHVIELIWDEAVDQILIRACVILQMKHEFFLCPVDQRPDDANRKVDRDIRVDCVRLRAHLAETLGK
ncbi:MAG: glycosyltransferase family 61 protein [Rhodospirillaceae bacterium]|nr:glycosyltransferase family 61 protein [Rhodospirillaceae bacterium]